jgi:hypothetical protein
VIKYQRAIEPGIEPALFKGKTIIILSSLPKCPPAQLCPGPIYAIIPASHPTCFI